MMPEAPATRQQLNYLESLIDDLIDADLESGKRKFEEMAGTKFDKLTRGEASYWIAYLSGGRSA